MIFKHLQAWTTNSKVRPGHSGKAKADPAESTEPLLSPRSSRHPACQIRQSIMRPGPCWSLKLFQGHPGFYVTVLLQVHHHHSTLCPTLANELKRRVIVDMQCRCELLENRALSTNHWLAFEEAWFVAARLGQRSTQVMRSASLTGETRERYMIMPSAYSMMRGNGMFSKSCRISRARVRQEWATDQQGKQLSRISIQASGFLKLLGLWNLTVG